MDLSKRLSSVFPRWGRRPQSSIDWARLTLNSSSMPWATLLPMNTSASFSVGASAALSKETSRRSCISALGDTASAMSLSDLIPSARITMT